MQIIGDIFVFLLVQPMLNALVLLYTFLFQNMALAIVGLTVVVRVVTFPLAMKGVRSSHRMQELQPKLVGLRERHKGNPQALQRETMKLYKEAGVSPMGCLGPMVIQFPIWIALYSAITKGLGDLPGNFVYLSQHLYSWLPAGAELLPLKTEFAWLDLTLPDPTPIMPLLVAASTWAQQKMMQPAIMTPEQRQQQTMMLFMFPIMLGFFALTFPSGLALYWFISNAIQVGMQGMVSGWSSLLFWRRRIPVTVPAVEPSAAIESRANDGREPGGIREDGRGGNRERPTAARNQPRRGRRRRP